MVRSHQAEAALLNSQEVGPNMASEAEESFELKQKKTFPKDVE